MPMIFKVQLSTFNSGGLRTVLVYDEKRHAMLTCEAPPKLVRQLKNKAKSYWRGVFAFDGPLILLNEVEARSW